MSWQNNMEQLSNDLVKQMQEQIYQVDSEIEELFQELDQRLYDETEENFNRL